MQVGIIAYLTTVSFIWLVTTCPATSQGQKTPRYARYTNSNELPDGYISPDELGLLANEAYRHELLLTLDRVRSGATERPQKIPQCTFAHYVYDPEAKMCGESCRNAHCGENMLLLQTSAGQGSCACSLFCHPDCFGRPLILGGRRCYKLATQGPCPAGEVLIPVNRTNAKCGPDACRNSGPTNALLISKLASYEGSKANKDVVFTFTYKNKCYMTETEAFCGPGKVVRFLHPYKSPFCVPADYEHCPIPFFPKSASYAVTLACPSGQKEDPARNVCVAEIDDILS